MSRTRHSVLTQAAGNSLALHSSAYAALSEEHFDEKVSSLAWWYTLLRFLATRNYQ